MYTHLHMFHSTQTYHLDNYIHTRTRSRFCKISAMLFICLVVGVSASVLKCKRHGCGPMGGLLGKQPCKWQRRIHTNITMPLFMQYPCALTLPQPQEVFSPIFAEERKIPCWDCCAKLSGFISRHQPRVYKLSLVLCALNCIPFYNHSAWIFKVTKNIL